MLNSTIHDCLKPFKPRQWAVENPNTSTTWIFVDKLSLGDAHHRCLHKDNT